jgi:anthranilate phosphoribosyltransferase
MTPAKSMIPAEERLRIFGAIVGRLIRKEDISRAETKECWRQICAEEQPEMQQGGFIAALAAKPETLEEIAGTFDALYEYDTTKVEIETPEPFIDNAGTGGDTLKTFNVSTAAAIVAAACGLYVVRHSSRAVSSNCGAIDVLQALGIDVESGPELPKQSIERVGICAWNGFLPWLRPRFLMRMPARIRFYHYQLCRAASLSYDAVLQSHGSKEPRSRRFRAAAVEGAGLQASLCDARTRCRS